MNTVPKKPLELIVGDVIALDPHNPAEVVAWTVASPPVLIDAPQATNHDDVTVVFAGADGEIDTIFIRQDEDVNVQPPEVAQRAAQIGQARALLDWLEANPDAPVPYGVGRTTFHIPESIGDEGARIAEVHRLAELMGVPVRPSGRHVAAYLEFGAHASYDVIATDVRDPEPAPADPASEETLPS